MLAHNHEALLTTEQAAEFLGLAPRTLVIWRSIRRYDLPYLRIGNRVRYRRSDLDAWLSLHRVPLPTAAEGFR
jgi:excisionase family DNA binding protein